MWETETSRLYDQLVLVSNLSSLLLAPVCGMSQVYTLFSTSQDAQEMDLTVGRPLHVLDTSIAYDPAEGSSH